MRTYEKRDFVPRTKVIFRVWKSGTKSVIAVFPEEPGTLDPYTCTTYEHVGQHGSGELNHIMRATRKATKEEYADLKLELEQNYQYRVHVRQRTTINDKLRRERAILRIRESSKKQKEEK